LSVSYERIAEIYRIVYGDAALADTYRPVLSVGTVSEAPPYILQCQQLAQCRDLTKWYFPLIVVVRLICNNWSGTVAMRW
jgi:hypothetical protein